MEAVFFCIDIFRTFLSNVASLNMDKKGRKCTDLQDGQCPLCQSMQSMLLWPCNAKQIDVIKRTVMIRLVEDTRKHGKPKISCLDNLTVSDLLGSEILFWNFEQKLLDVTCSFAQSAIA